MRGSTAKLLRRAAVALARDHRHIRIYHAQLKRLWNKTPRNLRGKKRRQLESAGI